LTAILPAIGFTSAIKLAKYDHHLVRRIIGPLLSLRAVIVPAPMIGTFGIAMLSGSRDATAIAFNKAVLPHAEAIAMEQLDLGSIAWLGGGLGRSMSPVAAATAMAAGYAGVSVFDIAKRTAVPALSVAVLVVIILEVIG
jgi:DcuC family C4-dicarboxylate transporter